MLRATGHARMVNAYKHAVTLRARRALVRARLTFYRHRFARAAPAPQAKRKNRKRVRRLTLTRALRVARQYINGCRFITYSWPARSMLTHFSGVNTNGISLVKPALTKSLASALSRDQNAPLSRAQKHTLTLARPVKRNFGFRTTFYILFVLAFGENASFNLILFPIVAIWQFRTILRVHGKCKVQCLAGVSFCE